MARKQTRRDSLQVSERVTLRAGDLFRATGGPVYVGQDGQKTKMGDKGPFRFLAYIEQGAKRWIEANCREGFTILWMGKPYRSAECPGLVVRPYKIKGRVGATRRQRSKAS